MQDKYIKSTYVFNSLIMKLAINCTQILNHCQQLLCNLSKWKKGYFFKLYYNLFLNMCNHFH